MKLYHVHAVGPRNMRGISRYRNFYFATFFNYRKAINNAVKTSCRLGWSVKVYQNIKLIKIFDHAMICSFQEVKP